MSRILLREVLGCWPLWRMTDGHVRLWRRYYMLSDVRQTYNCRMIHTLNGTNSVRAYEHMIPRPGWFWGCKGSHARTCHWWSRLWKELSVELLRHGREVLLWNILPCCGRKLVGILSWDVWHSRLVHHLSPIVDSLLLQWNVVDGRHLWVQRTNHTCGGEVVRTIRVRRCGLVITHWAGAL